jgi:hypothetical protein
MAYTEFYVQSTGSNLNAGSSTANAAAFTYAGGTWVAGTGVFTVASGNPLTDGVAVGSWGSVYTTAGATVSQFVGRVTARDATTVTLSLTAIAGSAAAPSAGANATTLKIDGAWAGPSAGVSFPLAFATSTLQDAASNPPRVNFKNGVTYNITAAITNANNGPIYWEGYTAAVGDGGLAYFNGDSASPAAPYTMLTVSGTGNTYRYLWFDDNGGVAAGQAVGNNTMFDVTGTANQIYRCRFTNAYRTGLRNGGGGTLIHECEAYNNQFDDASGFGNYTLTEECTYLRCISYYTTAGPRGAGAAGTDSAGWTITSDSTEPVSFINCIAFECGGNGFETTGNHHSLLLLGCISAENVQAGFHTAGAAATTSVVMLQNCLLINNGTFGVSALNATQDSGPMVSNCGFFSNASGEVDPDINASFVSGSITLTGDPFVNSQAGDFRLNGTAGAGAAATATGLQTFFINVTNFADAANTVGHPDVGAVQATGGSPLARFTKALGAKQGYRFLGHGGGGIGPPEGLS